MTRRLRVTVPLLLALTFAQCGRTDDHGTPLVAVQRIQSGDLTIVLLAPTDALKPTRNYCTLEFRRDGTLVDVGSVAVRTTMTMEGQPMDGFVTEVKQAGTGRYEVQMVLAMTGDWKIPVTWNGPLGQGSAEFSASVR